MSSLRKDTEGGHHRELGPVEVEGSENKQVQGRDHQNKKADDVEKAVE